MNLEAGLLLEMLEAKLDEVRVVRSRRTPPSVKRKRARYYRKRKARIKRLSKIRRRKPLAKKMAKRRTKLRKRLGLKAGSRRRIRLANSLVRIGKILQEGSMERNNKHDLASAFQSAAKLAKNLKLAFESSSQPQKEKGFVLDSDLPALPEFRSESVEWDYDLLEVICPKPVAEPASAQMDLGRMVADAEKLAQDCLSESIDLEEARQILCHVAESLDLLAEKYLTEETVQIDFSEPFVLTKEIQELTEKYGFDDDYEFLNADEAEAYLNSSSLEEEVVAKLKSHVVREMIQTQGLILQRPAQAEFQECAESLIADLAKRIAGMGLAAVSEDVLKKLLSVQIHEEDGFQVWISLPGSEVEIFKPSVLQFDEYELDA